MSSEGYEIIPMKPEEVLYSYRNSQQISSQTGLVGYIRADMGTNRNQFWVTWNCFHNDLNTPEFSNELSELLHSLRQDGKYLSDRDTLMRFCLDSKNALPYETGRDFGVRVNTRDHAYLMRLNPHKGEYNLYCYCYRKDWIDSHIRQAKRGIRFIDPHYREKFRIADGDEIIISGEPNAYTVRDVPARYVCRYIDDSHFEYGPNLRHICEFAEMMYNNLVTHSVAYMLMTRLGVDTSLYYSNEDFKDIVNFNTEDALNALGYATGDISEMALSEIAKTVLSLDRANRTFENPQRSEYNNNTIQPERRLEHDRDPYQ